ncbi:MAG TPA: pyrroloquinoline quinone-dependent dehydrogenase [Thermoanaerobaculia bacterium]|nr:pyrroloquinoline quinone-dependent dehydrogenase [Thermoanaerobaculia bacterium]
MSLPRTQERSAVSRPLAVLALLVSSLAVAPFSAQSASPPSTDWTVTTGDLASRRYSPLDQITPENVSRLEVAWRWSSPDNELMAKDERFASPRMQPRSHEVTPIKIAERLYATTGFGQLVAIDGGSGETLWTYDPEAYQYGRPTNLGFVHRGAAFWKDPADSRDPGRLLYAAGDAFLRAVDAFSGEPIGSFGAGGAVDLTQGLRREVPRRSYTVSSPVVVCRDTAIVGASISDGATQPEAPPGDVRGFDVRTGEVRWTFHSVPQPGEVGHDTWEEESWRHTGNTNVWTLMSADPGLGLVYLPFGTPTNDWYGGHRLGDNLFAESLVAVDCETGERRWHFQAVHHGLWDYDLVTSPILADVTVDGRPRKVAAQLSKQGFVYVLDRETGEPIWPIEEREVPQTGIPGERTSPTQPFPTRPPPYERQGIALDDLIDFTPELYEEAKRIAAQYQYGPLFTPPSEKGTINVPGWAGGASWPGGGLDPETGMLYVPSFTHPIVATLRPPDATRSGFRYVGGIQPDLEGPRGLPLLKPPYGRLTAYDLSRGEIAWVTVLGDGPRDHPALRHLDLPPLGLNARSHVLVTKTLLFVISAESLYRPEDDQAENEELAWRFESPKARALDKRTGEILWEMELPAHADGSPMTYLHEGRQLVVFALGGRGAPPELMALALAEEP